MNIDEKKFADQLAAAKARGKKAAPRKSTELVVVSPPQQQLQLPYKWPGNARGAPNLMLRNALFSARKGRESFGTELRVLASLNGHTIKASRQLNQHDLDNFQMLLHLQRGQPLGTELRFTAHRFLQETGRAISGRAYDELFDGLRRLATTSIEIEWGKGTFVGHLLEFVTDEKSTHYVVSFSPGMLKLFRAGVTQVNFAQRKALGKNSLAKWLQSFYAGHHSPFGLKVATLQYLSNAETDVLREFRRQLRVALDLLIDKGFLSEWNVDGADLVTVKKTSKVS